MADALKLMKTHQTLRKMRDVLDQRGSSGDKKLALQVHQTMKGVRELMKNTRPASKKPPHE